MRKGRPSAHRKHLTSTEQPRSLRIATTRPAAGAAIEKIFTRCRRAASGLHDCPLCRFGGAKMWLKKDLPDGRQVQRIFIPKGFDWVKTISPMLSKAGEGPVMWCPVTHFGYLESGSVWE